MSRLIDGDALLDGIYSDNPKDVMLYIARFPTVEPRKGKWIIIGNSCLAYCKCGYITDRYSVYNFCPNCGAMMSEGEENEKA